MKAFVEKSICVGIKEPREYNFNGRQGVSYAVEITDGSGVVELPVKDKETFEVFKVMQNFTVEIEFTMVAQATANGSARTFPRCRITAAYPYKG